MGEKIGKVNHIDKTTATAERGKFTRMSVETDLSMPLLSKFWLRGKIWKVQYKGLRMICYECGKIGNKSETCPLNKMDSHQPLPDEDIHQLNHDSNTRDVLSEDFGSWMMVKKPPARKRNPKPDKLAHEKDKNGNPILGNKEPKSNGLIKENQRENRFDICG